MRILILGGTRFLGRHLVEVALARRHQVTLFNRGKSNPDLFPNLEQLRGDRDSNLAVLANDSWDAVIDTCGYVPRLVSRSAQFLATRSNHYTFISSVSAYADFATSGIIEGYPLATIEDETIEEITGETYGPLKALCEQAVHAAMPGRALCIRPGLIVGPDDPTDRFSYWPHRIARGGEVLVPEDFPVQIIDVRDLAEWCVSMIEQGSTGNFNAVGPDYPLMMTTLVDACRQESGSNAQFTWVSQSFLAAEQVEPWTDLPLWVPQKGTDEFMGFSKVDYSRAVGAGLNFSPLATTIRDTLTFLDTRPPTYQMRAGLLPEREQALLSKWRAQLANR